MAARLPLLPLLSASAILCSCAQGSLAVSPGTVLSTIILAGEKVSSRSGPADSRSGTSRARIPASPAPSAVASRALKDADQFIGVKYTWGGNTPKSGFDCSGFTKFVFARQGITLPRTSHEQASAGQRLPLDFGAFVPGDILLFAEPGEAISHVAIYVGNGEIIHSSQGYGGVNYLDLNTNAGDWYVQNLVAARRILSR